MTYRIYYIIPLLLISNLLNLSLHSMEMESNEIPKGFKEEMVLSKEEIGETESQKKPKKIPCNWKQLDLNVTREKTIIPQGKIGKTKAWINLNEKDGLRLYSFKKCIKLQEKGLPFILSVLITRPSNIKTYTFYSAQELNGILFGENFSSDSYKSPFSYKDPTNNQIIKKIYYFVISGLTDHFTYLGSDKDIFLKPHDKKIFMKNYFLANRGDVSAQNNLGLSYFKGQGIKQDYEKAVDWFQKAADQEYAEASFYLGYRYFLGKDYIKAVDWFQKAANQGYVESNFYLGSIFFYGMGEIEKNYVNAFSYFQDTVNQERGEINFYLGCMYYEGLGVEKHWVKALECFKEAADQGSIDAKYKLGCMYYEGLGIVKKTEERNYTEAAEYFEEAAAEGDIPSKFMLAYMYEMDLLRCGEPNLKKALELYQSALNGGYQKAQEGIERVQKLLQEENQEKHD